MSDLCREALAIIPARCGSKRIPGKNYKNFHGKPIIARVIDVVLGSRLFSNVCVSTDCAQIAEIAVSAGAEVPFLRPENISGDHAPTIDVVKHAIKDYSDRGCRFEKTSCIYATAPFVTTSLLEKSFNLIDENPDKFIYPVQRYKHPIQRAVRLDEDSLVSFIDPGKILTRTQDLEPLFHDAGQFYSARTALWSSAKVMHAPAIGIEISPYAGVDLDDMEDWIFAEKLYASAE